MSVLSGVGYLMGKKEQGKGIVQKATEVAQRKVYGGRDMATVDRAKAIEAGMPVAKARKAVLNTSETDPDKAVPKMNIGTLRSGRTYTKQ